VAEEGTPGIQEIARIAPSELDYEVLKLIGRGGYGEVWLVRDKDGRYVACKVVYREQFANERPYEREYEGIRKFEPVSRANESQVNIIHVGRRDHAGYFYYLMELADDATQGQHIVPAEYVPKSMGVELKRRGVIPAGECIRLGLSLSAALENLHEHGLIHRDVKPGNIIFVKGIPKLADIGLVSDRDGQVSYVGTEGYIPPEGPGSAPGDVYALGKMLYEMSTGKDRLDYPELPTNLGGEAERNALLELNAVINKACERDLKKRYRTAAELHADLTFLSSGKSVRQRKRNQQRRRIAAYAGLAAAALFAFITATVATRKKTARSTDTPNSPAEALVGSAPEIRSPKAETEFARVCIRTGFEAFGANDYARVLELAGAAVKAGRTAGDTHLVAEAEFLLAEANRCSDAYREIVPEVRRLKEKPDDPEANLAVGRFECAFRNDWQAGLAPLTRGSDGGLKIAAEAELRQEQELGVGDLWWKAAEQRNANEKAGFQERARFWYRRAIAKMKESQKSKTRQLLANKLKPSSALKGEVHISSRVGNTQHIDLYADQVRWKSEGVSLDNRINHVIVGDVRSKGTRIIKNCGASRLYPEGIDFSTAQLRIDRKAKSRGNARLEIAEDHVRIVLTDRPRGSSEIEVTVNFGAQPPM
jgi:serine/threonine protein kinase